MLIKDPEAERAKQRQQGVGCLVILAIIGMIYLGNLGKSSTPAPPAAPPTAEHMLASMDGDPSSEVEFARILDVIQRGGSVCAPEPSRQHAGDVIYSSWKASAQSDTLLEWARTLASVCE